MATAHQRKFGAAGKRAFSTCIRDANSVAGFKSCMKTEMRHLKKGRRGKRR